MTWVRDADRRPRPAVLASQWSADSKALRRKTRREILDWAIATQCAVARSLDSTIHWVSRAPPVHSRLGSRNLTKSSAGGEELQISHAARR